MIYKILVGAWLACAAITTTSYVLYGSAMADRAIGALIAWAFILGILMALKLVSDDYTKNIPTEGGERDGTHL